MKIEQDIHVHTNLSLCAKPEATIENYVPALKSAGITTCGIANHFWDANVPGAPGWYQPQNFEHISGIKKDLNRHKDCGILFLFGAETEYSLGTHGVAITEDVASQLDFLLVPNSHTHITMPKEYYPDHQKHADYMYQAFMDIINSPVAPWITAVAHPFLAVCCPYPHEELVPLISDKRFCEAFEAAAKKNIAMEINTSTFTRYDIAKIENSNYMRMFRLAKKCGCKFTFGSDAHSAPEIITLEKAYIAAEVLELKESDLLLI